MVPSASVAVAVNVTGTRPWAGLGTAAAAVTTGALFTRTTQLVEPVRPPASKTVRLTV